MATKSTKPVSKKLTIDDSDYVRVINNCIGGFVYINRMGTVRFEIDSYGGDHYLYFKDLRDIRSSDSKIINEGWILIDNSDIVESWNLQKFYDTVVSPDDVNEFFKEDSEVISEKIKSMNPLNKNTIAIIAHQKYKDGQLDSTKKLRAIENALERKIFDDID